MSSLETQVFEPHKEIGQLIVVEGDPGAGKTSAIASVSSRYHISTIQQLNHITDIAHDLRFNSIYPEDWYLEAECARQTALRQLLSTGQRVLQDRCILSTFAFVYACVAASEYPERVQRMLRRLAKEQKLIRPDVLVIMQVDIDTSLRRRKAFCDSEDYWLWFDRDFLERYQAFYQNLAGRFLSCPTVVIDTTSVSHTQLAEELVARFS